MTIKDMLNNEELMDSVVEDLGDFPEDSTVGYEVWALGYDENDEITDTEILIAEYADPDKAIEHAKRVTLQTLNEMDYEKPIADVAYFSIEVETVVEDLDSEDGETINIGTIYHDEILVKDIDYSESSEDSNDPIVAIAAKDYTLLEDGTLKVSCNLLKGFNKNDYIRFQFVGEAGNLLTYKIISKVTYEDGDYFHCEFEY